MGTRVVNLRKEPFDVYIGRPGRGFDGRFGNPFRVGHRCRCGAIHLSPGGTISCFRVWFQERLKTDLEFRAAVRVLAGKRLGCFCKPGPCHGDVIAEWADRLASAEARAS